MGKLAPRRRLLVCCVSQNCLAEAYLRESLRKDTVIRPISLVEFAQLPCHQQRSVIFVVDEQQLEVPLREYIRRMRLSSPDGKVLLLSHEKSREQIVRVLISGAHGFLPHEEVAARIVPAVLHIAANNFWVPPEAFRQFLREVGAAMSTRTRSPLSMTPREEEILELVGRRLSNREIADLLRIRVSTVKFHLSNILSKFHVHSRHALGEIKAPRPCNRPA